MTIDDTKHPNGDAQTFRANMLRLAPQLTHADIDMLIAQARAGEHRAAQPLTPQEIKAAFQKYGTGRLDGFTDAVLELCCGIGKEGGA